MDRKLGLLTLVLAMTSLALVLYTKDNVSTPNLQSVARIEAHETFMKWIQKHSKKYTKPDVNILIILGALV